MMIGTADGSMKQLNISIREQLDCDTMLIRRALALGVLTGFYDD